MKEASISRRGFVKANLAALGALGLGAAASGGLVATKGAVASESSSEGEWRKAHCGCCTYQNCGIEVKVVDGVAVEIRGNAEHPVNKGTLCPRSASQLMALYNPYRVKAPLKRTNPEKGLDVDPGWVEIDWDEAIGTVADKLDEVQKENPNEFMYQIGFSGSPLERPVLKAIPTLFNTSNLLFANGPLCEIHYSPYKFVGNHLDKIDLGHCNYLLDFGRSVGGAVMYAAGQARALTKAIDRGMKMVVVNPHETSEAAHGEWIPIRPAGDMAMLMAIGEVMLCELEQGYDVQACKNRTNAPYLVDGEGMYIRNADGKPMIWDASDGTAKAFDAEIGDAALEGEFVVGGQTVTTCFEKLRDSLRDATPEWAEGKCDVSADRIRRIATEFVEAAQIGSTIDINGTTMPYRPACITVGRGCANTVQGRRAYWLAYVLNTLIGGVGVPGSLQASSDMTFIVDDDGMFTQPGGTPPASMAAGASDVHVQLPNPSYSCIQFYPLTIFPVVGDALRAVLDPERFMLDYEIKVNYFHGANTIQSHANSDVYIEAYKKIPFSFTNALVLDEPTQFCDIVFADTVHLERWATSTIGDILAGDSETFGLWGGTNLSAPVVDPVYNCKQCEDTWLELISRVLGPQMVAQVHAMFGGMTGHSEIMGLMGNPAQDMDYATMVGYLANAITKSDDGVAWFKQHGFLINEKPAEQCYDYWYTDIQKKSRFHIYDYPKLAIGKELKRQLDDLGIEIPGWEGKMDLVWAEYIPTPKWIDNFITKDNEEFDLYAVNWKITNRNIGENINEHNPWLREIVEQWSIDDLSLQINPKTAQSHNIKTGDTIRVTSQNGASCEGVAKVTNLIHPDAVGFPGQAGGRSMLANPISKKGSNYNQLLTSEAGYTIPDSGCLYNTARVKIEKIG